jgi:putative ABC transport system permease protein
VSVLSAQQRDLIGVFSSTVSQDFTKDYESVEGTWGQVIDRMEQLRQNQPEPLRSLMQPGQFYADVGQPLTPDSKEGNDIRFIELQLRVDPFLADHVDLVDGQWPDVVINASGEVVVATDGTPGVVPDEDLPAAEPVQVAMSAEAASELDWEIGEARGAPPGVELSGTFEANDPESARWQHAPNAVTMGTLFDGNVGTTAFLAGYLNPANPGTTGPPAAASLRFWYPLDGSAVAGDEVDLVTAQLLGLTSAQQQLSEEPLEGSTVAEPINTYLASELTGTFRDLSTQQRATASILAVVAAGPVGVTLAAFALAARLIVSRRRSTLALSSARGGSTGQVRSVLALEGLLLGLPAAGLGYAAAGLVRSGSAGWSEWVVAGLVGLVPAASLALSSGEGSLREQRADLHGRSASRVRWIAEVIVLALAGVAVWRLLDRGLTGVVVAEPTTPAPVPGGADAAPATAVQVDTGVDLLMAATPVLLALAACVLTLRLYPVPVQALTRLFRARPGLTAFLGSARSVREPAGGLVPALAVILGISVAVFSAVMASTITIGAQSAAWSETGAEIRLSGPRVTDELLEQVQAVEGVREAAGVREAPRTADLTGQVTARGVSVYVVDTALQQVQADAPVLEPLPQALYAAGSATPVLTGGEVSATTGTAELTGLGPVRVVGHVEELPGVRTDAGFLVVDRTLWEQAGGNTNPADVALITATDPDQREQVAAAVAQAIPNALIETPQEALEAFASAPVTSGLTQMFVLAVALTTALTVLAIVLVQLMGAPARARLLAVLRTLGLAPRQGRTLTAWELAPLIAMAFAVGAVVGLAIPWLLLRAIDLTGLTGGSAQPPLALDWPVLGLVCGGILLTVTLAVTTSAAIAGRTDLARELRIGEQR